MLFDPPTATGQPTLCASPPRSIPKPAVVKEVSGRIEWAANPAISARAGSSRNAALPTHCAGHAPTLPNAASVNGALGGKIQWRQQTVDKPSATACDPAHHPPPGGAVSPKLGHGAFQISIHNSRGVLVHRVPEGHWRLSKGKALTGKVQGSKGWRRQRQRVDGRADVVPEPRKREFLGPQPAAHLRGGLHHDHSLSCRGQSYSCDETVGSGADNNGVRIHVPTMP